MATSRNTSDQTSGEIETSGRRSGVGFRFNPFEHELISYYLKNKITGRPLLEWENAVLVETELYGPDKTPWELFRADDEKLPWQPLINPSSRTYSDSEKLLFVFTQLSNVAINGGTKHKNRNRVAGCGTWRGNTAYRDVKDGNGRKIGSKRMFTFKSNEKTIGQWTMYEYTIDPAANGIKNLKGVNCDDYVICQIKRDDSRFSSGGKVVSRKRKGASMLQDADDDDSRLGKKRKSRTRRRLKKNQLEDEEYEDGEEIDCLTTEQEEEEEEEGRNNGDEGGSSCSENPPEPPQIPENPPKPPKAVDEDYAPGYAPFGFCDWEQEDILIPNMCQGLDPLLHQVLNWPPLVF